MILIDKLCYQSNLRYVNAGEKIVFALLTLLMCVVSRSIAVAILVLAVNGFLTIYKGGISLSRYMHFMKIPLAFLILSTVAIVINFSKTPMDAFAVSIGNLYITSGWKELHFALQLILTALASVSCLYFLSLSTPMTDILAALKKMHCPTLLIELMLLIYRFIFVLLETASAITTSQNSRMGNKDFKTQCKAFGNLGSALLIRAFKRSNALYDAMEARCYDGTILVLNENNPPKKQEVFYIIGFEVMLCVMITLVKVI